MSRELKGTHIPLVVVFLITMLMFAEFFAPSKPILDASAAIRGWALIIAGFAILVGYITLLRWHFREMMKMQKLNRMLAYYLVSFCLGHNVYIGSGNLGQQQLVIMDD